MSTYQTEEEQVEAIKKWWKDNGVSVIGGVVLGFAAIGGWQGWDYMQRTQGESASILYDQMLENVLKGNVEGSDQVSRALGAEHANTAYAHFAAYEMAKIAYQKGEKEAAIQHAQAAVSNAPDDSLAALARIRLAVLALDSKDFILAKEALAQVNDEAFKGEVENIKGDIALAEGDKAGAIAAYQAALSSGVADRQLVKMKLIDAGGEA